MTKMTAMANEEVRDSRDWGIGETQKWSLDPAPSVLEAGTGEHYLQSPIFSSPEPYFLCRKLFIKPSIVLRAFCKGKLKEPVSMTYPCKGG